MSLAIVHTRAQAGVHALPVTVEVHLSNGLPSLSIVGLPETAVKESKDRVRSAILNSQFEFPQRRITINLAPADLPKEGGRFDLPIAIGILAASGQIPTDKLSNYEFTGELALSGELRSIHGILPFALACSQAQRQLFLPTANANEAAIIEGLTLYPAQHLLAVCGHLNGKQKIAAAQYTEPSSSDQQALDLNEVHGQAHGKRALEVAAVGGHNLLLFGPPGTGKTMLASRLPTILPPLTQQQAIEVASIYSITGNTRAAQFYQAPFRRPHHTASAIAIVGGGSHPRPGEVSLAHQGVLFLDELPEFDRRVLEVLREPIESGVVSVTRIKAQTQFPARFQLIAAMNPCPCGYHGSPNKNCCCSPSQIQRYRNKLSGPLLDRIDMHIEIPDLLKQELHQPASTEPSHIVRLRVIQARDKQLARQGMLNAQLSGKDLQQHCRLGALEQQLLQQALDKLQLSARCYHRILKVARSIADLANNDTIGIQHLTEAISYRKLERNY